jgi:hypothetical protein
MGASVYGCLFYFYPFVNAELMKEKGFEVFQNYTNEEDASPLIDLLQQNQIDYVFEPPSNPGEYTIVKNFLENFYTLVSVPQILKERTDY